MPRYIIAAVIISVGVNSEPSYIRTCADIHGAIVYSSVPIKDPPYTIFRGLNASNCSYEVGTQKVIASRLICYLRLWSRPFHLLLPLYSTSSPKSDSF